MNDQTVSRELFAKVAKERDQAVKKLKESVPLTQHFEQMIISAERYAFGRRTYIVGDTCDYIIHLLPRLSDWCLGVMFEDFKSETERSGRIGKLDNWGDDCDRRKWVELWKKLTEEIDRRKANGRKE